MKLIYRIIIRIALMLTVVLGAWAVFFYIAVIDEVNDEVDDSLEDYSETIIIRALAGEELPSKNNGSNNQYYLRKVSKEYADEREDICYKDSMVYIVEKEETEPARILTTLFKDDEGQYYELTVSTPTIEKDDLKDAMLGWIIFLYIVLLLTILIVCIWIFHRSMKPLYNLLRWLDAYRIGRPNRPLKNETQITEFRKLNEAAIRNAERSEHIFEQQKQFIGNASHEMQTPLAICRNRLEMLMEDDSLSEAQLEELIKTHQTLEHITKLNKSLLLLSKIDNGQFSDTRTVEFNSMLKRYIEDYKEAWVFKSNNDEFIGTATAVSSVAALHADKVSKEEFKEAMSIKKRNRKVAKAYIKQTLTISPEEQYENYKAAYNSVEKDFQADVKISKMANTNMDKAVRKKKEQKATANIDLSIFLQKENEQEQELYLFETDKILAQEALQQNKKIRGSL